MTLPAGFDTRGLAPVIYVYDRNLRLQYTYQHPQISNPPQQDFKITSWSISGGINSNAGRCSIQIEDHVRELTDDQGILLIRPGWHIQILLGKSADNLQAWFFGIVNEPKLERPGYNQQYVSLTAFGYSHTLSTKFATLKHDQDRNDSGKLDNTDMSACVSELVKAAFATDNLLLPPPDPNLTLNGIDAIDVKLASINKQSQSQGIIISELANIVNAVYGVTPDLDFYFHTIQKHSGFVITNDLDTDADPEKLMIIRKQYQYTDTAIRKAVTSLIGSDLTLSLDILRDVGGSDTINLTNSYDEYGFEITYTGEMSAVQLYVQKPSAVSDSNNLVWQIRDHDSSETQGIADGTQEASGSISGERLNELIPGTNPAWLEFSARLDELADNRRRILWINNFASFSRPFNAYFNTNLPDRIWKAYSTAFSASQRSPAPSDGTPRMRIFGEAEQTLLKAQNLAIQQTQLPKEQVQRLNDRPTAEAAALIFEGLLDQAGQLRRIYSMQVSAPDSRPPLGQQCAVIDVFNNLNSDALLIAYDIGADRRSKLTAIDISLELETILT